MSHPWIQDDSGLLRLGGGPVTVFSILGRKERQRRRRGGSLKVREVRENERCCEILLGKGRITDGRRTIREKLVRENQAVSAMRVG